MSSIGVVRALLERNVEEGKKLWSLPQPGGYEPKSVSAPLPTERSL